MTAEYLIGIGRAAAVESATDCGSLATTGMSGAGPALLASALLIVLIGLALLTIGRRRRAGVATLAVLLLCLGGLALGPSPAAQAGTSTCVTSTEDTENSLEIVQTAVLTGLSPTSAPEVIAGTVTYAGNDSAVVASVRVSIHSVTKAEEALPGVCDASDYLIVDPVMLVGRTLRPGESAGFSGATIEFVDKATNQNACKLATVTLLYTAVP
jgi:hypothetical protein